MALQEFSPNKTLFQYTSIEGFKGIVKSKTLWLSDLRSLNDPRELIFGLGQIRPILTALLEKNSEDWDSQSYRQLFEVVYQSIENTNFFTACFTPHGDKRPMWRDYGQDGKGISIGFRPRAITDLPGRIQKVDYLDVEQPNDEFSELLEDQLRSFENFKGDIAQSGPVRFGSGVTAHCTSTKHSSWVHEAEIRCTYSQPQKKEILSPYNYITAEAGNGHAVRWQKPSERENEFGKIQYVPFEFGKRNTDGVDPSGAIEKVFLGPNCELREPEIRAILSSEGFTGFKILASECAWR